MDTAGEEHWCKLAGYADCTYKATRVSQGGRTKKRTTRIRKWSLKGKFMIMNMEC